MDQKGRMRLYVVGTKEEEKHLCTLRLTSREIEEVKDMVRLLCTIFKIPHTIRAYERIKSSTRVVKQVV